MARGILTADDIIKAMGGNATSKSNAISLASDTDTSSGTTYDEAAKIVQTLVDGMRAQSVETLEKLTAIPDDGISLPVVTGGQLKTLGTDVIMNDVKKQFQTQIDDLVVGQVPSIPKETIEEITNNI